ncbi:MAG: M48 family metallopeptidase [Dinoroseobacter sp.]|nr:M48 family metallopeptidase [Dinoroseobacter sp.]
MRNARIFWALSAAIAVAGCTVTPSQRPSQTSAPQQVERQEPRVASQQAVSNFEAVVARVEPVAERECRARTKGVNCDFKILVDTRKGQPINAFQTLSKEGQPLIVFTVALIADARNRDELAFVLGHEAAHHVEGHLAERQQEAQLGAMAGGILASILTSGSSAAGGEIIDQAMQAGAFVGARAYSKDKELEADALGTVITARAGYDPVRGAAFFSRIPDPGDQFLGTHPPNAARIQVVRQVAAGL